MQDFIMNGQATGSIASTLIQNGMNPSALRPYLHGPRGKEKAYVDVPVYNEHGELEYKPQLVHNAVATLRKDDWKKLDAAVIAAAKPRLRAVADLNNAGLTYDLPNAMGKTVFEHEKQSDISEAEINMDGITNTAGDRPQFELEALPIPITSKDFNFTARQVAVSRTGNSPIDTTTAALAGRRVAESIEKQLLGVASDFTYGGGTIQGYTTFDDRATKSMTTPDGTNNDVVVREVISMKIQLHNQYHYGPYFCYCSSDWDQYMDDDYSGSKGSNTLRDRIGAIENVDRPKTLDYLPANTLLLVAKNADTARMVNGMQITTVQWESKGGMQLNFKVLAIMVPQLRSDYNDNCGICHGTYTP